MQNQFLRNLGLSEVEALCQYRLAPLSSRRDMALLGVIHRTVLGCGPEQFKEYFKAAPASMHNGWESDRRHGRQLLTHREGRYLEILGHSILGLVDVYNLLPTNFVNEDTVPKFQGKLQKYLVEAATNGVVGWQNSFSPRLAIYAHPLRYNPAIEDKRLKCEANNEKRDNTKCINNWLNFAQ